MLLGTSAANMRAGPDSRYSRKLGLCTLRISWHCRQRGRQAANKDRKRQRSSLSLASTGSGQCHRTVREEGPILKQEFRGEPQKTCDVLAAGLRLLSPLRLRLRWRHLRRRASLGLQHRQHPSLPPLSCPRTRSPRHRAFQAFQACSPSLVKASCQRRCPCKRLPYLSQRAARRASTRSTKHKRRRRQHRRRRRLRRCRGLLSSRPRPAPRETPNGASNKLPRRKSPSGSAKLKASPRSLHAAAVRGSASAA